MRVCVVGSGGREHALARALARHHEVIVSPGNPAMEFPTATDPETIDADLFVVGPEGPLVDGLADRLRAKGRLVFGPGADGAQLEGSKAWMKELLVEAGVPTARFGTFQSEAPALEFLDSMTPPYVVKTDGLAAGKGVLVTESLTEARNAVGDYLSGAAFGEAGKSVVIEEGLVGPEVSVLAVCDGQRAVLLPPAQDFKRLHDGDLGPNTGGMGAYSPVPGIDDAWMGDVLARFIEPTLAALRARSIDYRGVLYAGMMLTADGPKILEYNVRFGDPECQVVVPRLDSDLGALLAEAAAGELVSEPKVSSDAMVTVVAAAEGYPLAPRSGDVITGIALANDQDGVSVLLAGVSADADGNVFSAGGRVLNICGRAATLEAARSKAYAALEFVEFRGKTARTDIARKAAALEHATIANLREEGTVS